MLALGTFGAAPASGLFGVGLFHKLCLVRRPRPCRAPVILLRSFSLANLNALKPFRILQSPCRPRSRLPQFTSDEPLNATFPDPRLAEGASSHSKLVVSNCATPKFPYRPPAD
ncbi:hypothetical protein AURDEDRAFT_166285 [Auricularia subglabra TFB-10046 SS5]|uniref:Uncharacterized protein n=1 Tax=Auricularia subglabra (strain TFB-10046 / SS5) TaxID=717982 RepID=J0D2Y6_AURST|nr:hypothetical protein AURDEDRAFT_166285 [Auricularia subglabra TFB-10046 SS5]